MVTRFSPGYFALHAPSGEKVWPFEPREMNLMSDPPSRVTKATRLKGVMRGVPPTSSLYVYQVEHNVLVTSPEYVSSHWSWISLQKFVFFSFCARNWRNNGTKRSQVRNHGVLKLYKIEIKCARKTMISVGTVHRHRGSIALYCETWNFRDTKFSRFMDH
jgi:hypothetical protein